MCNVMSLSTPNFQNVCSEKLYEKESSFQIMLSEMKMSGEWKIFWLLLIYLKHSIEKNGHFIKSC